MFAFCDVISFLDFSDANDQATYYYFFVDRVILPSWTGIVINLEIIGYLSFYATPFLKTSLTVSSWLVVVLAIDRFILIYLPHRAKSLMTIKRSYITVALIVFFTLVFALSTSLDQFMVSIGVDSCNGHWLIPRQIVNPDGTVYNPLYYQMTYAMVFGSLNIALQYVVPAIMIIVFNWLIISTLRRQRKVRDAGTVSNNSKKRVSEIRLTKMIITVNVLFLVCNLPYNIFRMLLGFLSRSLHITACGEERGGVCNMPCAPVSN